MLPVKFSELFHRSTRIVIKNNSLLHDSKNYEAKLCILCIVNGFRNRPKSDLSRNPQYWYFSLIFFAVFDSRNKHLKYCTAQNCSKIGKFGTVYGTHKRIIRHMYSYIQLFRNLQLQAESANGKWNPHFVCGFT